jgi:hypothetical protein
MSPSEYQQLTDFFVAHLGRFKEETRAFVAEQLDHQRAFVGVSVESLRHEIRLVADGVLTNRRAIEENSRRIDDLSGRVDEQGRRFDTNTDRLEALTHTVASLQSAVSVRFQDHEERLGSLE